MRKVPLVVLGVLFAHSLQWHALRAWTCGACVALCALLGLPVSRLGDVSLALPGHPITIGISCTMIDVFCGAVPLLWPSGRRLLAFFGGLLVLNLVRLVGGFWLLYRGVAWELCHEVVAGVVFFLVLEWVVRWQPRVHTSSRPLEYAPGHD